MAESLNERLDRIELSIAELTKTINDIKRPNINKKQVVDIDLNQEIKKTVTRDFVTKLYRG